MNRFIVAVYLCLLPFASFGLVELSREEAQLAAALFVEKFQSALAADNRLWIVNNVDYPLRVTTGCEDLLVDSSEALLLMFDSVFTPEIREVVGQQTLDSLFLSWRGIMVGNGEVWMDTEHNELKRTRIWAVRHLARIYGDPDCEKE